MISGIFGTGAPKSADANLILQIVMGVALLGGMLLARLKKYTAHAVCQSTVLFLNAIAIVWLMWPSFRRTVIPRLPKGLHRAYYVWPVVHGTMGALAEAMGIYIALGAATNVLPKKLEFRRWKSWMRFELALWWFVLMTGIGMYLYWYTALL